jgi:hypothetical protein
MINRRGFLIGLVAVPMVPLTAGAQSDALGDVWFVHEELPDGQAWDGVWRRRGLSQTFDARWRNLFNGAPVSDVLEIESVSGSAVTIFRQGNGGTYVGTLSPSGRHIRGTASWYPPGAFWSARIED